MSDPLPAAPERAITTTPPADVDPPVRAPGAPPPGAVLPAHYAQCFGCGPDHPTGLRMHVTAGEGVAVTARFVVTEHHQGAPGLAHGGLLSVAFDEAMGFLLLLLARPAVTGRLDTDYLRPVPVGSTLRIAARCVGTRGRKIYTRGEGRLDEPGAPVAVRSTALFVAVPLEHFAKFGRPESGGWRATDTNYNP